MNSEEKDLKLLKKRLEAVFSALISANGWYGNDIPSTYIPAVEVDGNGKLVFVKNQLIADAVKAVKPNFGDYSMLDIAQYLQLSGISVEDYMRMEPLGAADAQVLTALKEIIDKRFILNTKLIENFNGKFKPLEVAASFLMLMYIHRRRRYLYELEVTEDDIYVNINDLGFLGSACMSLGCSSKGSNDVTYTAAMADVKMEVKFNQVFINDTLLFELNLLKLKDLGVGKYHLGFGAIASMSNAYIVTPYDLENIYATANAIMRHAIVGNTVDIPGCTIIDDIFTINNRYIKTTGNLNELRDDYNNFSSNLEKPLWTL